jgi:phage repressor protein C with HTH and peptisase S24 domain
MEPMYSDGDIVFVKANVMVESGQVGVFVVNDEGYLKMLQGNKLISLNKDYKPIVIEEWDSFFCSGRVVGKTILDE